MFKQRILFFYGDYFWDLFETLNQESQEKFNRILQLISTTENISRSIFKHVTDSRGIFEIRIVSGVSAKVLITTKIELDVVSKYIPGQSSFVKITRFRP